MQNEQKKTKAGKVKNEGYFFKPWKGERYENGWKGLKDNVKGIRTLVVGVAHICTLPCPHHGKCGNPKTVRTMDMQCPAYGCKSDYYRLSNSNEIEIRSFIDSEARYPGYSAFTYYMTGTSNSLPSSVKQNFWESVSFTNILQYFLEDDNLDCLKNISKSVIAESVNALLQVCKELEPELILVWNPTICDWLKDQSDSLRYIGQADMTFQLSLYVFMPVCGELKGDRLRKLKYRFGIKPVTHKIGWYKKLVKTHLGKCIKDIDKNRKIAELPERLKDFVKDGALGTSEEYLYFKKTNDYSWSIKHIRFFIWKLKTVYGLGQGANDALAKMFNDRNIGKYSTDIDKMENDPLCRAINKLFK